MGSREDITRELLAGEAPYQLSKKYPRATVYRIFNELRYNGQIPGIESIQPSDIGDDKGDGDGDGDKLTPPVLSVPPKTTTRRTYGTRVTPDSGVDKVDVTGGTILGEPNVINRIRGILGIQARPKVLSMPMPELLYPSMVIATTELGFPPMTPDNFIDTVLYQWLEACDYLPYVYMKKSELEKIATEKGIISDEYIEGRIKAKGLMSVDEFAKKYGITLPDKEVEKDGSTGHTESDSTQSELQPEQRAEEGENKTGGNIGGEGNPGSPAV